MCDFTGCVLHVNTANYISDSPTVRIGRFISEYFDIPFVHDLASAKDCDKKYDVVFLLPGVLLFSGHREQVISILEKAKRVVHLENDYFLKIDGRILKAIKGRLYKWTTVPKNITNHGDLFVNWNQLTWDNIPLYKSNNQDGLFYYGAYREGRVEYFKKYFGGDHYDIKISSYPKNHELFKSINPNIHMYKPFGSPIQIRPFKSTIYLEDTFSHDNYTCPANRFYECLYLGVAQWFDASCKFTFEMANIDISPYIVNSAEELSANLHLWDKVRRAQRVEWHRDYYDDLVSHLDESCPNKIKEMLR